MIEVSTYSQIVQVVPLSGPSELTVSPQLLKRVSCQSNVSRGKSVIGAFICPLTAPVALRLEVLASALEVGAVADVQMGDVALLGAEDGLSVVILGISQCLCHTREQPRLHPGPEGRRRTERVPQEQWRRWCGAWCWCFLLLDGKDWKGELFVRVVVQKTV